MSEASIRPALITAVLPDSIAAEIGFEVGDQLVSINGQRPRDLIDYQFLCADEVLALEVLDIAGKPHQVEIEKDYDDDLGLEFENAFVRWVDSVQQPLPVLLHRPSGKGFAAFPVAAGR